MSEERPRTLADYFDDSHPDAIGGVNHSAGHKARLDAIVIDGRPLGTYELDFKHEKERTKRFIEYQWVGISLVGCGADLELIELRSLPTRPGKATPDFEATTHKGEIIRIELCRLVDEDEMKRISALSEVIRIVQARLDKAEGDSLRGGFHFRLFRQGAVEWSDVSGASAELGRFIETDTRLHNICATLWEVGVEYPTLHSSGAHVAHLDADGPPHVEIDLLPQHANLERAMKAFQQNFDDKKAKYDDYSNGHPVWLVFVAQSYDQRYIAASLVEHLRNVDTFDPGPFQRVLFGCFTMGVTFEKPFEKPRYTDLDTA